MRFLKHRLASEETLLFHASVLFCNGAVGGDDRSEILQTGEGCAEPGQGGEGNLRRHVADKNVLGEGTSAEAADGGVEAAATGVVSGGDFGGGLLRTRVEMDAKLDLLRVGNDSGDYFLDKLRCGKPHGVGERDAGNAGVGEQVTSGDDFVDAP